MKFIQTNLVDNIWYFKGALLFLIGPLDAQLAYVGVVVLIDLMFGMKVAKNENVFSWSVLASKVTNKIFIYGAWIAMFNAIDMTVGLPNTARNAVILVLVSMEIFSASKNTAKLGYGRLASLMENVYYLITKDNPVAVKKEGEEENKPESEIEDYIDEDEVIIYSDDEVVDKEQKGEDEGRNKK